MITQSTKDYKWVLLPYQNLSYPHIHCGNYMYPSWQQRVWRKDSTFLRTLNSTQWVSCRVQRTLLSTDSILQYFTAFFTWLFRSISQHCTVLVQKGLWRSSSYDKVRSISFRYTSLKEGMQDKSEYHWPALFFFAGLTTLRSVPIDLLKAALELSDTCHDESDSLGYYVFGNVFCSSRICHSSFLQSLFEAQSHELTTKVITEN